LTSISRPVAVTAADADAGHHRFGIWKSPTNFPVDGPVSTRVNPVAPSPLSVLEAPVKVALHSPFVGVCHLSSSNVTSNNLPS
jgi:hypothetical protein